MLLLLFKFLFLLIVVVSIAVVVVVVVNCRCCFSCCRFNRFCCFAEHWVLFLLLIADGFVGDGAVDRWLLPLFVRVGVIFVAFVAVNIKN